ncbi:MAG TPA: hypothetical protein VF933_01620 [Streptosporangiaceae bacterium]
MIRWWLLLAAAGVAVSACSSGQASLARSSSHPVAAGAGPGIDSPVPGGRDITSPGGMAGSATLPQVTYPSLGINVSARPPASPGKFAADAVSPGVVLAAFKSQEDASLVGTPLSTERPAIMLRTITELHPTAPGVRPHVPYTGWVVIYRHVQLVSYGLRPFSKNARGTFVAIMDTATGQWTNFFNQGSL